MRSVDDIGLGGIVRQLPGESRAPVTMVLHVRDLICTLINVCGRAAGLMLCLAMGSAAENSGPLASHAPIAVNIVEKGVYEAETISSISKKDATGLQNVVRNPRLIRSTAIVPGRIGVRFGVRYVVGGPTKANVDLKLIIRFPDIGLVDPKTGARYFESEYRLVMRTGTPGYWEYQLENDWEIVPGVWYFEFWSNAERLAVERFCVIDATRALETESVQKCPQILIGSHGRRQASRAGASETTR